MRLNDVDDDTQVFRISFALLGCRAFVFGMGLYVAFTLGRPLVTRDLGADVPAMLLLTAAAVLFFWIIAAAPVAARPLVIRVSRDHVAARWLFKRITVYWKDVESVSVHRRKTRRPAKRKRRGVIRLIHQCGALELSEDYSTRTGRTLLAAVEAVWQAPGRQIGELREPPALHLQTAIWVCSLGMVQLVLGGSACLLRPERMPLRLFGYELVYFGVILLGMGIVLAYSYRRKLRRAASGDAAEADERTDQMGPD